MTKDLSYLSYPLPPDIQRLFEAGDFDRMARVIRQRLEDPRVPKTLHERLRFQLIIAKEIPEYSFRKTSTISPRMSWRLCATTARWIGAISTVRCISETTVWMRCSRCARNMLCVPRTPKFRQRQTRAVSA